MPKSSILLLMIVMLVSSGCTRSGGGGQGPAAANIVVDGDISDWTDEKATVRDPEGDATEDLAGADMVELYISQDDDNVFIRIDLANGTPAPGLFFGISFGTDDGAGTHTQHDRFIFISMKYSRCTVNVEVSGAEDHSHEAVAEGQFAAGDGVIELSVSRSDIGLSGPMYVSVCNNTDGDCIDRIDGGPLVTF